MATNKTNFKINGSDFNDMFIPNDLFSEAGLWNWGEDSGNLGQVAYINRASSPIQTASAGSNWKQCAGGAGVTAGIKTDGTLWLWGTNSKGRLGDNTETATSSPVQTAAANTTNWKQVALGTNHTMAIKTDGTLWGWGQNEIVGTLGTNDRVNVSSPVQTVAGGSNWKLVTCGGYTTAAIKNDGTLWTWGRNLSGELGDGTGGNGTHKSSPVQTVAGGTNWRTVSYGGTTMAAIKTDGTLWLWGGTTNSGHLGNNSSTPLSSPVQTVAGGTNWKSVACGSAIAAIKTDGTLWTWGTGSSGELGDNTTTRKSSPVQTIAGGTNWKSVATQSYGTNHTAAIKTDGTLWLWGLNQYGKLGNNTQTGTSSPIQTVAAGTNWKQVALGNIHTVAIRSNT